MGDDTEL